MLNRLARGMSEERRRGLVLAWGIKGRDEARRRARGKQGRRFWKDLARTIQVREAGKSVFVETAHVAAAQKQFGGAIEAKNARALTIPLTDEARGKRVAEFKLGGRTLFRPGPPDAKANVLGYATADGTFVGLYALVRRTKKQKADPFFPIDREFAEIGEELARKHLERNS